jgi:transposase-like protein
VSVVSSDDCTHENIVRVPRLYVDGRPLFRCTDCNTRLIREDDAPSYKGLAPLSLDSNVGTDPEGS